MPEASSSTYKFIENERSWPSPSTLIRVAYTFEVLQLLDFSMACKVGGMAGSMVVRVRNSG